MKRPDISVIVLTYNESIHLKRCIESIQSIAKDIFVVDSYSQDNTLQIADKFGAKVVQHPFENQARQLNWALDNLPIKTKWVLRLDADEYLYPELIEEIKYRLDGLSDEIAGVVFKRRHIFLNKWMNRGTYPVESLRLFRYQRAICEQRLMDEHIYLLSGHTIDFQHDFADHNLNNLSWWSNKHVGYSIREAVDLLDIELNLSDYSDANPTPQLSEQAATKRQKKLKYVKLPLFWRSFAYFIYRYIFKLGFLEGKEGFLWHFLQGWWYRTLVDAKIFEIKKACGNNPEKIKEYILTNYQIKL